MDLFRSHPFAERLAGRAEAIIRLTIVAACAGALAAASHPLPVLAGIRAGW